MSRHLSRIAFAAVSLTLVTVFSGGCKSGLQSNVAQDVSYQYITCASISAADTPNHAPGQIVATFYITSHGATLTGAPADIQKTQQILDLRQLASSSRQISIPVHMLHASTVDVAQIIRNISSAPGFEDFSDTHVSIGPSDNSLLIECNPICEPLMRSLLEELDREHGAPRN